MPTSVVLGHLEMLPALQAEESLRRVTEIAAGNGLIKKADREQVLGVWRRAARKAGSRKRKQTLADLSVPGLPIVEVKKGA